MARRGMVEAKGPLFFMMLWTAACVAPDAPREEAEAESRLRTERVILITADGLRQEELFTGIDPALLHERAAIRDEREVRVRYWRDTPEERRQALMPFFWGRLAPQGIVLGNKAKGSSVRLTNPHRFSYPGYAEILTGRYLEEVTSNDSVRISRETVLDFAQRKLALSETDVATFASWEVFSYIVSNRENAFFCNAGYQEVPAALATPRMRLLTEFQARMLTPWDSVRHDAVTASLALEYLEEYQPRLLYVALGETDDWAHDGRYDRVIQAIRLFDDFLKELWERLESLEAYRGRTTLILTTDHGRGTGLEDWRRHGSEVEGAEDVWIAVIGPDTPNRGEVSPAPDAFQNQVAATLLGFLDLDETEFDPSAGAPLAGALEAP